jgi:prohibitin 1
MNKLIASGIGSLILIIFMFASCTTITPGNVGVVFNKMTGSLRTEPQGIVWRIPFISRVQSYPISLRTYTMVEKETEGRNKGDDSIDLPTAESQHIHQDLSVTYNTSPDQAAEVFRSFRGQDIEEIEETFIRRTVITVAQNISGQMHLQDVTSTKRNQLQDQIQEKLSLELKKMGFNLDKVNLGAAHLPPVIEQQLQQKMAAQQLAEQAQFELLKNQTLAQAAVAKATGERDSNRLLQQSISPELLRLKTIEKWDGHLPQVQGGGTPLIQLGKQSE